MNRETDDLKASIGLIGMPTSGKTAYIWVCAVRKPTCPGWQFTVADSEVLTYVRKLSEQEEHAFDRQSGDDDRPRWQNTQSQLPHTTYKLFNARPRGLRRFLQPKLPVSVPDMPGELIKLVSRRPNLTDAKEQIKVDQLIAHLRQCAGLICLIDPTLPTDGEVSQQAEYLEAVVTKVLEERRSKDPLALSLVLTKVDSLTNHPRRSMISLKESDCLRLKYLNERKINPASAGITMRGRTVKYLLADAEMFRGPKRQSDPEHDKAVAWDYLNCHLPAVAHSANEWTQDGRATVRVHMISAWGGPLPRNKAGFELVPYKGEINPIRVMDPIRSVIDRVSRRRRDRKIRRILTFVAVFLFLVLVLGPLSVPIATSVANWKIGDKQPITANWVLQTIESHPIIALDRQRAPTQLVELADANYRLSRMMSEGSMDDQELALQAADRALRLTPDSEPLADWRDGLLEKYVGDRVKNQKKFRGAIDLLLASATSPAGRPVKPAVLRNAVGTCVEDCRSRALKLYEGAAAGRTTPEGDRTRDQLEIDLNHLGTLITSLNQSAVARSLPSGSKDDDARRLSDYATSRSLVARTLIELSKLVGSEKIDTGMTLTASKYADAAKAAALSSADDERKPELLADAVWVKGKIASVLFDAGKARLSPNADPKTNLEAYENIVLAANSSPSLACEAQELVRANDEMIRKLAKARRLHRFWLLWQATQTLETVNPKESFDFDKEVIALQSDPAVSPGEKKALEIAAGLMAYRRVAKELETGEPKNTPLGPEAKVVNEILGSAQRGRISQPIDTEKGSWDPEQDLLRAHAAVDQRLTQLCLEGLGSPTTSDDLLKKTADLASALPTPSIELSRATACVYFHVAAARAQVKSGSTDFGSDYGPSIDPLWAEVSSKLAYSDVRKAVADSLNRLLNPRLDRPENAFCVRRLLGVYEPKLPERVAILEEIRTPFDQQLLKNPNRLPTLRKERLEDLARGYVDILAADQKRGDLLAQLYSNAVSATPTPIVAAAKMSIMTAIREKLPEIDHERIVRPQMELVREKLERGLSKESAEKGSVVPDDLKVLCKELDAKRALAAIRAVTRLEESVKANDLIFLQRQRPKPGLRPIDAFYLARNELSFKRYAELVKLDQQLAFKDDLEAIFRPLPKVKQLPQYVSIDPQSGTPIGYENAIGVGGDPKLLKATIPELPMFPLDADRASRAAITAQCRLPTEDEWRAVAEQRLIEDAIKATKGLNQLSTSDQMKLAGDINQTGHIGLRGGLREWVTVGHPTPGTPIVFALIGGSWEKNFDNPGPTSSPEEFPGLINCGVRLAADAKPVELIEYFEAISK